MQPTTKICDKKTKTAELKLQKILHKIESFKLNNRYISQLKIPVQNSKKRNYLSRNYKVYYTIGVIIVLVGVITKWYQNEWMAKSCLVEIPSSSKPLFRPPEDCSMCTGVESVARVGNISAMQFEERFAYGTEPVIVTDGMKGWRAVEEFNFKFFAEFYKNGKMGSQTNDCFFFAYKSGLRSLQEVFSMEESRANLSGAPWYVGWSTCFSEETRILRSYYNRPYFLPTTAESDMVDWVFMGGPGEGAHMHVDSVRHKSWQAQVRGRKQWQLAPPPECLYHCRWITFTVEPTEILVVDTNRWYHKTNVLPGDISITIGAEYD